MKNSKGLNVIRWVIAAVMWMMALGTLSFGGVGILGAILFAAFGFIVSPLSSKFLFPLFPNLKKSHKILGAAGIWLAANVFMGIAVPPAAETDLTNDVATVAESTTEIAERSMPSSDSLEETESTTLTASAEKEIEAQKTAEEESKKASEEAEAKKAAEEAAQKAAEEAAAQKAAEEAAAQKAAEEAAAQKAAEEAAAQKAAEEAAAQKAAEEAAAQKAAEEAAAQKAAEEAAAQKAAEEAAQKAAEEAAAQQAAAEEAAAQRAAEESAQQTTANQSNYTTTTNGTENANALAVINMGPTTGSPCWVPRHGGTKYHTNYSCSGMDDPIYTTVDTAAACGFDACKRCHR